MTLPPDLEEILQRLAARIGVDYRAGLPLVTCVKRSYRDFRALAESGVRCELIADRLREEGLPRLGDKQRLWHLMWVVRKKLGRPAGHADKPGTSPQADEENHGRPIAPGSGLIDQARQVKGRSLDEMLKKGDR